MAKHDTAWCILREQDDWLSKLTIRAVTPANDRNPVGRPGDRLTAKRRQVRDYVLGNWPCPLGKIMRGCRLHDRSSVKRILKDLVRLGEIPQFITTPKH